MTLQLAFNHHPDSVVFYEIFKEPIKAADSTEMVTQLRGCLAQLHAAAYFEAGFEDCFVQENSFRARCTVGQQYRWLRLSTYNIDPAWLRYAGFNTPYFNDKTIKINQLHTLKEQLLNHAENNGYPFASIWLDSIQIHNGQVSATLMADKGALFQFDSIRNTGSLRLSPRFLRHYLSIKKGAVYSRALVVAAEQRLRELPYLTEKSKPSVSFNTVRQADLTLALDAKQTSFWDVLVGLQPTQNTDGSTQFAITFNGKVDFQNILGNGERLYAHFENVRPESPRVNIKCSYPFVLDAPFGVDATFDLYKRDTTYIETRSELGFSYLTNGSDYLKFFWQRYGSRNILINATQIINTKRLPPSLDLTTQTLGIEYQQRRLDYRFNPRRGWLLQLRGGAGQRTVMRNADILNLRDPVDTTYSFSRLYDTISLKNTLFQGEVKADYFIPILKRSTLKIAVTSGGIFSVTPISQNEQYRIGGSRLLRGFDEESVLASRYAVGTLEYRWLIGRNAYFYAFGDMGFIENKTRTVQQNNRLTGIGGGITFETRVGLFGVTFAVGKQNTGNFDFRTVKTHFGYVSLF